MQVMRATPTGLCPALAAQDRPVPAAVLLKYNVSTTQELSRLPADHTLWAEAVHFWTRGMLKKSIAEDKIPFAEALGAKSSGLEGLTDDVRSNGVALYNSGKRAPLLVCVFSASLLV